MPLQFLGISGWSCSCQGAPLLYFRLDIEYQIFESAKVGIDRGAKGQLSTGCRVHAKHAVYAYSTALGLFYIGDDRYLPQNDHFTPNHKIFAKMFWHEPTKLIIGARYIPAHAETQTGWDPITWSVATRKDLDEWGAWLDLSEVKRSCIFTG